MEDMSSPNGVARDLSDHWLRQPTNLNLEIEDVESPDAVARDVVVPHVAVVATDALIAPGAEGVGAGAGKDDGADGDVVTSQFESARELEERLRAKRITNLGTIDRDSRDPVGDLVDDVGELIGTLPLRQRPGTKPLNRIDR